MGKRNIEDGFTLPERRKACREGDAPVSTKEYRYLRKLEKAGSGARQAYADLDKIQQETARECSRLGVMRGKGPKAVEASALREYDRKPGFNERIRRIGSGISNRIIADFKKGCNVADFLNGGFPSEDNPLDILEIVTLPMGWNEDECAPEDASEDMRENFLYRLREFVTDHVRSHMQNLVEVVINHKSIWDKWNIKVNLTKSGGSSPKTIDAEVFFEPTRDYLTTDDDSI